VGIETPQAAQPTPALTPRARFGHWLYCVTLGLSFGAILTFASPPVNLWPLAALNILPLALAAIAIARRPGRLYTGAIVTALGTLPAWYWLHLFLFPVTGPGYVPLGFVLASYSGFFVWLMARWLRAVAARPGLARVPVILLAAGLWGLMELLRGDWVLGGYALYNVATPLIRGVAPLASIIGCIGVAAAVGGLGWMLAELLTKPESRRPRALAPKLALLVLLVGLPAALVPAPAATGTRTLRVGMVQTNLPQSNKIGWSAPDRLAAFERWTTLTRQAATAGAEVIVWPETMFPGQSLSPGWTAVEKQYGYYLPYKDEAGRDQKLDLARFAEALIALNLELGRPLLVGAIAADNPRRDTATGRIASDARYNSVFLIRSGTVETDRYDKGRLVPFGEYVPIAWRYPAIQNAVVGLGAKGMSFDLGFGTRDHVFELVSENTTARAITPICFEMTYPMHCRDLVYRGGKRAVDVIITASNDGWFGDWDSGRSAHLLAAQWRAAELGTPVVRSVNTGISCVIDAAGTIVSAPGSEPLGTRAEGVLVATVPLATRTTVYSYLGDWPAITLGLASLGIIAAGVFTSRSGPARTDPRG